MSVGFSLPAWGQLSCPPLEVSTCIGLYACKCVCVSYRMSQHFLSILSRAGRDPSKESLLDEERLVVGAASCWKKPRLGV